MIGAIATCRGGRLSLIRGTKRAHPDPGRRHTLDLDEPFGEVVMERR